MRKYIKLILEVFPIFIVTYLIFHYLLLPVTISGNSMYPYEGSDEQGVYVSEMTGTKFKFYEWGNEIRN